MLISDIYILKNNHIDLFHQELKAFYTECNGFPNAFDNEGIEDLLVGSQWYTGGIASGKYNELVILSKKAKDKPIEVTWRIRGPNW